MTNEFLIYQFTAANLLIYHSVAIDHICPMDIKLASATGHMLVSCPHLIGEHGNWRKQKQVLRLIAITLIALSFSSLLPFARHKSCIHMKH